MNCSIRSCLPNLLETVIHSYLFHPTQLENNTVCLIWDEFDFDPIFSNFGQFVILRSADFSKIKEALEKTFCERFVVFGNIILPFLDSFMNAVVQVTWRSSGNYLIFVEQDFSNEILSHRIVKEIPDILFLKSEDCCVFETYTSQYLSLYSVEPEELYLLDVFNGTNFKIGRNLFPDKKQNFLGRTIRLGLFDYPPFNKFFPDEENGNVWINNSNVLEKYFLEGLESNILLNYCKKYNCTIEIVTCNYGEWGDIYSNLSGEGQLGLLIERKVDIVLNSMYLWANIFEVCGMSRTMSRSGITFLIPVPR